MSNETFITIKGRLTGDPELRFTPSGSGVANFTVASNARYFDKNSQEWADKEATFWRCNAWNQGQNAFAETVAESLEKGQAVIVYGEVESRKWQTKEGENRTSTELRVDAVGPDLRWAKPSSGQQSQQQGWGGQQQTQQQDPWGAPATNEPPF